MDKLFNPFTLLAGPGFVAYVVYKSTIPVSDGGYHLPSWCARSTHSFSQSLTASCRNVVVSYFAWLLATRTLKLLPHLWHRPQDILYVPAFILFGYYFAIMKIYALLTLHEVRSWAFLTRSPVLGVYMAKSCRPVGEHVQALATLPQPPPQQTRTATTKPLDKWRKLARRLDIPSQKCGPTGSSILQNRGGSTCSRSRFADLRDSRTALYCRMSSSWKFC